MVSAGALMLLYPSSSLEKHVRFLPERSQQGPYLAGKESSETAADLLSGPALFYASSDKCSGGLVRLHADDDRAVEGKHWPGGDRLE
jgi:hypothetical protein